MSTTITIVDPTKAPLGKEPRLLGVDHIEPDLQMFPNQRYRTEAWRLSNGELVVIVSDNGGTSLMNASEAIAAAVDARWYESPGTPAIIVEDWSEQKPFSDNQRFVISTQNGGNRTFDFNEWDSLGLALPRP